MLGHRATLELRRSTSHEQVVVRKEKVIDYQFSSSWGKEGKLEHATDARDAADRDRLVLATIRD